MGKGAYRIIIVAVVVALVAATIVLKNRQRQTIEPAAQKLTAPSSAGKAPQAKATVLPTLLDFGRGQCVPCKMMAPILQSLAKEYEGRAVVRIIDIGDEPALTEKHGIKMIPTQIFFDANGKEVSRHEGFMPKADIVAKLREMGVASDGR